MPELPEVEITARRLDRAAAGATVESALAPGMVTLKTFDPPLEALAGATVAGVRRAGKMLVVELRERARAARAPDVGRPPAAVRQAGVAARPRLADAVRLDGERELRLREFGTQQRAWAKLLPPARWTRDEAVATLGPRAPSRRRRRGVRRDSRPAAPSPPAPARPAHDRGHRPLVGGRDPLDRAPVAVPQGRRARLRRRSERIRAACDERLGGALEHYEEVIGDSVPDKLPMPLEVHRRGRASPARAAARRIEAVHFKDYVMCYCPEEQTGGRVLKDRRLSRLLK